ncbi:MAG TPA: PAS domain S-box protein [Bacteroidia bacterium]|nr:PAS domain S-box protein [Bacteroidia bacterium]
MSNPIHTSLNNIPYGILLLDTEGYIQHCNTAVTTLTGYNNAELKDKSLKIFYPNTDDDVKINYELEQARKLKQFVSEGWRLKKDKSNFWAEFTLSPCYDEKNKHTGYHCTILDRTQKKQEELKLRKSEEQFRHLVEGVENYSIFMLDTEGIIVTWNEGAKRITGYSTAEAIGKHFSIFYTSEDLKKGKPEIELSTAVNTGKYEEEGWRVRRNGTLFWGNIVLTALYNEENKLIGFSKVQLDLTERRESETQLRQSEERYRSLVEQVRDYAIFILDEKGRIASWNEGAKRIKGYTAEETIGKYFSIFYTDEDIMMGKPAMELRTARQTGKYEEEGWRKKKDGSLFWANVVLTAIYNHDGVHIGFSKVTRDLTERKEAERELHASNDRLRQLANELQATNKQLTNINQELEQFTSIVSHDLQEPIRTIRSFLDLIDIKIDDKQYDELKVYIGKSLNAAARMKELIISLLNYSQLSKTELEKSTISTENLINEVLQNLKGAIETIQPEITVDSKVEMITGDPVQLRQLLQNLLSNALKFTNAKHPKIKITCIEQDGVVKFSVSDNGIGINEDDKHKVFEIFRRLSNSKGYPGTGIGLAICKKIVERHKGTIWLESEPKKGTTFYFTINPKDYLETA